MLREAEMLRHPRSRSRSEARNQRSPAPKSVGACPNMRWLWSIGQKLLEQ